MVMIDLQGPVVESAEDTHLGEIMGMVGLAGRSMGVVSLHCSLALGFTLTSNLLGAIITEIGEEVEDAIGEVANMVAGNFKTRMSQAGEMFDLSVPTVIIGKDFSIKAMTHAPSFTLGFSWRTEKLYVRLNLRI